MKGTRLWQAPGSPIIQGRSRRQRPFWQPWAGGLAASCAALSLSAAALSAQTGAVGATSAGVAGMLATAAASFPGATVFAAAGAWFSRRIGTRHPWVVAALCGLIGGLFSLWVLSDSIIIRGVVLK